MLFGLLCLTFAISHLVPGDPARLAAGPDASEAMVRDGPRAVRPRPTAAASSSCAISGAWPPAISGESLRSRNTVRADLARYFPNTFELVTLALLLAVVVGIPLGMLSAVYKDTWIDHWSRVVSVSGVALPAFWLGPDAPAAARALSRLAAARRAPGAHRHAAGADHASAAGRRAPARAVVDVRRRRPARGPARRHAVLSRARLDHAGEPGGDAGDAPAGLHQDGARPGLLELSRGDAVRASQRDDPDPVDDRAPLRLDARAARSWSRPSSTGPASGSTP